MEYIDGDVLAAPSPCVIAHGCNALGVMGAGLALQIALLYPKAEAVYKQSGHRLGACSIAKVGQDRYIANLVTQPNVGAGLQTSYPALRQAMQSLIERMEGQNIPLSTPIYIPFGMCCGYGGGDWLIVKDILLEYEEEYGISITAVNYAPKFSGSSEIKPRRKRMTNAK